MSKLYIAYGSNLDVASMARRCPDARVVGAGILHKWRLSFNGFATIEPDGERNTPVLVWDISAWDEESLDRYEGFPNLYSKEEVLVQVFPEEGGEPTMKTCMVYVMNGRRGRMEPSPSYYKILKDAYEYHHFPKHVLVAALARAMGKREAKDYLERNGLGWK